jgi:iron(III) transport system substrate-binding protein
MVRVIFLCALSSGFLWAQSNPKLGVYSSRHYDVDHEINELFTQSTGIEVQFLQIKEAAQLVEKVKLEAKRTPADVIITVDVGNLWRAKEAGILQSIQSDFLFETIEPSLRDSASQWFALSKRARVLVYNKEKVKAEELSTYENLADPRWKSRLLVRTSTHVYNQSLTASLFASLGEKQAEAWIKGVTANLARKPEGGDTDQIKAVAAGVGDIALVNSYYVARIFQSKDKGDQELAKKLGVFFPNQKDRGTHINVSGGGVTKYASNKENAIKYLEFLLSEKAQKLYADANHEYPVNKTVKIDSVLQNFGEFKADQIGLDKVGANTPAAIRLMDKVGWR